MKRQARWGRERSRELKHSDCLSSSGGFSCLERLFTELEWLFSQTGRKNKRFTFNPAAESMKVLGRGSLGHGFLPTTP